MPSYCSVIKCNSNASKDKVSFHRFPSIFNNHGKIDPLAQERRQKWIKALRRADLTDKKIKYGFVCSKHFIGGKPSKLHDKLSIDWVPNQNLGYKTGTHLATREKVLRQQRATQRRQLRESREVCTLTKNSNLVYQEHGYAAFNKAPEQNIIQENNQEGEPQDDLVLQNDHKKIEALNESLINANLQIYELREKLGKFEITLESFENNEKCRFYTGLEFQHLKCLFDYIQPHLPSHPLQSLTKFQMLILTLLKLRLNFLFKDLGYRFGISRRSASRCFFAVLDILYIKLRFLICWPDRKYFQMNVPLCFLENFGTKVTAIIDCFEIFTETPINKNAAAQHFSNYKHHNTIKFLLGISPQGSIIFISNAFTGRCSDKFVVEHSGFLDKLNPGDLILADRGFLITEQVKERLAEVYIPAFLKGAKQLMPMDVEKTRNLANVRIHVERIISQIRQKYNITAGIIPISILKMKDNNNISVIDKILNVCCALVNMCPSVI